MAQILLDLSSFPYYVQIMNFPKLKIATAASALLVAFGAQADVLYFNMHQNSLVTSTPSLFLFGAAGSNVSVSNGNGFNQNVVLGADGFLNLAISSAQSMSGTGVTSKGFKVVSAGAIGGYAVNRGQYSSDMTYLYTADSLGKDYMVASQGGAYGEGSQISVTATQDNTAVTINRKGGAAINVVLNAGQTYKYAGGSVDQTGARVVADKAVAVFSGADCANVPSTASACDHLVEQMISTDKLGKRYLLAETKNTGTGLGNNGGNLVRVIGTQAGSEVKVNGAVVATLGEGQVYEFTLQDGALIESNHAVMVAQYLKGQSATAPDPSDPSLALVISEDSWLKNYRLATPTGSAAFTDNWANVVIRTLALGSMTLNGLDVDDSLFSAIGGTGYSFANLRVSPGLFNVDASEKFQLMMAGFGNYDSYMTIGGSTFSRGISDPGTVPEPTSVLLAAVALLALGVSRRRT